MYSVDADYRPVSAALSGYLSPVPTVSKTYKVIISRVDRIVSFNQSALTALSIVICRLYSIDFVLTIDVSPIDFARYIFDRID